MIINDDTLRGIYTGFSTLYSKGFTGVKPSWSEVAMRIPSSAREQTYGFLGQFPKLREWLGPRVVGSLVAHGFTIQNKDFESTVAVPRNDIEDDTIGVFGPMFEEMGQSAAEHPDLLVFQLLKQGFTADGLCYDGQSFFDTDHPVKVDENTTVSKSNVQAGAGEPWYLLDTSRAIKPIIYQERRPYQMIRKDNPSDDNVFFNKEFIYGVDGRSNVGFGLWQMAFGSKAALTPENYAAARASMMKLTGDEGRLLGVKPTLLVCGPDNEEAALELLNAATGSGGASNPWKDSARLICTPWVNA